MNDIEMDLLELDGLVSGLVVAAQSQRAALKANQDWIKASSDRLLDLLRDLGADGRRLEG